MDKQAERYNIFTSLEDVKQAQCNQRFYLERIDEWLAHIELHFHRELAPHVPPGSSARDPTPLTSLNTCLNACFQFLVLQYSRRYFSYILVLLKLLEFWTNYSIGKW